MIADRNKGCFVLALNGNQRDWLQPRCSETWSRFNWPNWIYLVQRKRGSCQTTTKLISECTINLTRTKGFSFIRVLVIRWEWSDRHNFDLFHFFIFYRSYSHSKQICLWVTPDLTKPRVPSNRSNFFDELCNIVLIELNSVWVPFVSARFFRMELVRQLNK